MTMQCKPCPNCGAEVETKRDVMPTVPIDGRRLYTLTCWECSPKAPLLTVSVPADIPEDLVPQIGEALGAAWDVLQARMPRANP